MTGAEIKAFLTGNTTYLETTAASASGKAGQGVIYWGEDGNALYKTPAGAMFHGKWEVKATPTAPPGRRARALDASAMTRREMSSQSSTPAAVRPAPRS